MPDLEYFLVADSIATDRDRNTVSVFHILEEWPTEFPLVIPSLVAVSSWNIAPDDMGKDFQALLDIKLPGARSSPDFENFPINFTAEKRRHRTYHFVQGLRIEQPGEVIFRILLNQQYQATHRVTFRTKAGGV